MGRNRRKFAKRAFGCLLALIMVVASLNLTYAEPDTQTDLQTPQETVSAAASEDQTLSTQTTEDNEEESVNSQTDSQDSAAPGKTDSSEQDSAVEEESKTNSSAAVTENSQQAVSNSGNESTSVSESTNTATSPAKVSVIRREASSTNTDGVDLGQYLTGFTAYKKDQNGKWVEATTFTDGEDATFTLDFTVPGGKLSSDQKTLTYSLGENVVLPDKDQSGNVTQNGKTVGKYSITKDGKVTITLNDDYDTHTAFKGNITFEGTVKNTGGNTGSTVNFGTKDSITIRPNSTDTDLKINKQGWLQTSGEYAGYIKYEIDVVTTKGTDDNITLTDLFKGVNSFTADQMKGWTVKYNGASGATGSTDTSTGPNGEELTKLTPTYSNTNDNKGWSVTLPQVKKSPAPYYGQYTIVYYVKPDATTAADGKQEVTNNAQAHDINHWPTASTTTVFQKSLVSKTSSKDDTKKKITWTITVRNSNPRHDMSKDTFKDIMTEDGTSVSLPSTIYVDHDGTKVPITVASDGSFKLPTSVNGTGYDWWGESYTITYKTDYPTGPVGTQKDVSNKIDYTPDGGSTYTSGSNQWISGQEKTYGVFKWDATVTESDATTATLNWFAKILLPEATIDKNKIIYTDTLTTKNGGTDVDGKHYTTPALLQDMYLYPTTSNDQSGTALVKGTDYIVKDPSGNDITNSTSTDHITGFTIEFTDSGLAKVQGMKQININYSSNADYGTQENKEGWNFNNKGEIPGYSHTGTWYHYKDKVLDKRSSATDKTPDSGDASKFHATTYKDNGITVEKKDGIIYYSVVVKVPSGTTGTLTLTDTFPEGLSYIEGSAEVYKYGSDDDIRQYDDNQGTISVTAGTPAVQSDGTTKVDFTVDGYRASDSFILFYKAKVEDENFWKNQNNTDKDYINNVTWGTYTDSTTTHVTQNKTAVDKEGAAKKNEDGTWNLTYHLKVNPTAQNLDPDNDNLTLTDTLSIPSDSGVNAYFDPSTIKVYNYDPDMPYGCGSEVSTSRYGYQYDEATHKLTITLPDQLACVITYQYNATVGLNDATISNTAELKGVANSSTKDDQKLTGSTSSATTTKNIMYLYKVDSNDAKVRLSGVTFKLEEYKGWSNNQEVWEQVEFKDNKGVSKGKTKTTDAEGKILFTTIDDGLKTNTLYRIVETDIGNNPGYVKNTTPKYFIWKDKLTFIDKYNNNKEFTFKDPTIDNYWQYFTNATTNIGSPNSVQKPDIQLVNGTGNVSYPNEKHAVSVKKVWLNADNTDLNDPTKIATVTLYRRTAEAITSNVTVNVTCSDGVVQTKTVAVSKGRDVSLTLGDVWSGADNSTPFTITYNGQDYTRDDKGYITIELGKILSDTTINLTANANKDNMTAAKIAVNGSSKYNYNYGDAEVVEPNVELNQGNSWSKTWTGLDATNSSGQKYYYYIEEDPSSDFDVSYSSNNDPGTSDGTITVTNKSTTQVQYKSFEFTKKWYDQFGYETDWPKDITVTLTGTKDGSVICSKFTVHQNANGTFTATKSTVDGYDGITTDVGFSGGKTADGTYKFKFDSLPDGYTYTLSEDLMQDYDTVYDGDSAATNISEEGMIVNSQKGEKADFSFTKQWYLENELTKDWQKDIVVTLTGRASDTSVIASKYKIHKDGDTFTITKTNIDGTKKIPDLSVCKTSGSGDGNFIFTFTNLPKTDENGNAYTYSVTEEKVIGFQDPVYGGSETKTFAGDGETIQNKNFPTEYTELEVDKQWLDSDGNALSSVDVDSVHVKLYQVSSSSEFTTKPTDGGILYKEYDVKKSDGWKLNIKDLPSVTYDEEGTPTYYGYYLLEVPVSGYTSKQEVDAATGNVTLTNTKLTKGKSITVNKVWSGVSSSQIQPVTVELHRVGTGIPATIHLMTQYTSNPVEKQTISTYSDGSQIMVGDVLKISSSTQGAWLGNATYGVNTSGGGVDLSNVTVGSKDLYIYMQIDYHQMNPPQSWDCYATSITKNTAATDSVLVTQILSDENQWSYSWDLTKIDGYTYSVDDKFYISETDVGTDITTTIKYVDKDGNEVDANSFNNGTVTVTNSGQYQDFSFTKNWEDSNGNTIPWPSGVDSLKFTLTGSSSGGDKTYAVTVTQTGVTVSPSDGSVTGTVSVVDGKYHVSIVGLPNGYTYTLTEKAVDGYVVKYQKADEGSGSTLTSISNGQIITNKQEGGYVLPDTGGSGTLRYVVSGALLIAAALLFYIKKRQNTPAPSTEGGPPG